MGRKGLRGGGMHWRVSYGVVMQRSMGGRVTANTKTGLRKKKNRMLSRNKRDLGVGG